MGSLQLLYINNGFYGATLIPPTEITVANLRVVNLLKAFVPVLAAHPRDFTVAKGHNGAFTGRLALATDCKLKGGMRVVRVERAAQHRGQVM